MSTEEGGPYTIAEFARLPLESCARCGEPARADACLVTTYGDDEPMYMPGLLRCTNPWCATGSGSTDG